jgi:hypothetical protein
MGGPTGIFGGIFNIYGTAASVDNMNYASKTLWGGVAERYVVGGVSNLLISVYDLIPRSRFSRQRYWRGICGGRGPRGRAL